MTEVPSTTGEWNSEGDWSDEPASSSASDRLGRLPFAKMISDQIDAVPVATSSTVFGLVGPWGSGKTSIINFVRESLANDWNVAVFSPWAVPDSKGLAFEFLAALASAVKPKTEKARRWTKSVANYARLGTPFLDLVPIIGVFASKAADRALESVSRGRPWRVEFDNLSRMTADLEQRILIIADDVDRLDTDELLTFLKVVRLLGRFPNVHYLIAYDQATVEDLLNAKGVRGQRASFMEKIVQYPFEMPSMSGADRRRMVETALNRVLDTQAIPSTPDYESRASELVGVLASAMQTPRAHARFGEQLFAYSLSVSFRELDFLDFAALSYIRIFHHDLFDVLPEWERELRTSMAANDIWESKEITGTDWSIRILEKATSDMSASAIKAMSFLFPAVSHAGFSFHSNHARGLNEERYFERYFVLGIASNDIEDEVVERALASLLEDSQDAEASAKFRSTVDGPVDELAALAFEKALDLRRTATTTSRTLALFLLDRLRLRLDQDASFASPTAVLWRWAPREIAMALTAGLVNPKIVSQELGESGTMNLLLQLNRDRGLTAQDRSSVLEMFVPPFEERVKSDLVGLLEEGKLRISLALLARVEGVQNISGVLDEALTQRPGLFDQVVRSFVWVQEWVGSGGVSPELAFDHELFAAAISSELRRELLGQLPEVESDVVDGEDLSEENRARYAYLAARQVT